MELSFKMWSDFVGGEIEVIFEMSAYSEDEVDILSTSAWNGNDEVQIEELPLDEQVKIETTIEKLADENASEAYLDYQIMKADQMLDSWKDGD